jgi:hypothetical protein
MGSLASRGLPGAPDLSVVAEGVPAGEGWFELVRAAESARLSGPLQDALLAGEVRLDGDAAAFLAERQSAAMAWFVMIEARDSSR